MNSFENKILIFAAALQDVYREEEDRENIGIPALELKEDSLTEDFTAMIYAMWLLHRKITENEVDPIEFTHICNKLVVQKIIEETQKSEQEEEA